jgi:zinc D-Ala-D-Ala carboxypeptidase
MLLTNGKRVNISTPIYPNSHFSWGEATDNCSRPLQDLIINHKLIISARQIEQNIVATAAQLDEMRSLLGNRPLKVNSWYRPQHINHQVGGTKDSRHLFGDAVDIKSDYLSPQAIYKLLNKIHMYGGLGRYHSFVHIDFRGEITRWFG